MKSNRALFLDRDGVLNAAIVREGILCSPRSWNEIQLNEDLFQLDQIKKLGYFLVMVTNQPDLERKLITQEFIDSVHSHFKEKFHLDAVYCCPFSSNDHPMKKPNPGMLLQAAQDLRLDLKRCVFLGDTEKDVGAAVRCECKSILWNRPYNKDLKADYRIDTFVELRSLITSLS